MLGRNLSRDEPVDPGPRAESGLAPDIEFDIALKPSSHPELGDILIDGDLFAIGRNEPPFASFPRDIVVDLSRRHAKIFAESGAVYLADLGSKNGTTVNGADVRQKTTQLQDGDEICFGGRLCYRAHLRTRVAPPSRATRLLSMTLTPERADLGLQPVVVTHFPFLISKSDDTFARYKEHFPQQVNYLSRRHAHVFLKGGVPHVEDLGSTNGTFVDGTRLEEHAVPLRDGEVLAFGGHHFVYRVSLQTDDLESNPTVTKFAPSVRGAPAAVAEVAAGGAVVGAAGGAEGSPRPVAERGPEVVGSVAPAVQAAERDKTTFVAAADSFLDIFCADSSSQQDDEVNTEDVKPEKPTGEADGMVRRFRRQIGWGAAAVAGLSVLGVALYFAAVPERGLKHLVESGKYAEAARIANERLGRDPGNSEVKALGTESWVKAFVPQWLDKLKARDFKGADATLTAMKGAGSSNADTRPLVNELAWVGTIEEFVLGRGGPEAPIRIYTDEERLKGILKSWEDGAQSHQQAFATISAFVPAFNDPYADALSHLRKLQSDDAVYLPAMERLKEGIATALNQDHPEALEATLNEAAGKYPRIGNLDNVRRDLQQYRAIQQAAASGALGSLVALVDKARFSTPPFRAKFQSLIASGRLPSADVVAQYGAIAKAWRAGTAREAFAGLERMSAGGPWAGGAANELAHKKQILEQFTELQKAQASKPDDAFYARLLAFHGSLDPDEDVYFLRAASAGLAPYKDKALRQAQEDANRAQLTWAHYRENGAISAAQRLEGTVSNQFRTQARLLSEAQHDAQQGIRIYSQLKLDYPVQWKKAQDEINAETDVQRKALLDLRNVLEPGLLKTKLALLGGESDEGRKPSKAAR